MTYYACAVAKKLFLERQERESTLFRARSMILEEIKALDVFFSSRESRLGVRGLVLMRVRHLGGSFWGSFGAI